MAELVDIALEHGFPDLQHVGLIVIETSGQFVCLGPDAGDRSCGRRCSSSRASR